MELTDAEREKFAAYLEMQAASDSAVADQMQKIGTPEAMIKAFRLDAMCALRVAGKLRSVETQSI